MLVLYISHTQDTITNPHVSQSEVRISVCSIYPASDLDVAVIISRYHREPQTQYIDSDVQSTSLSASYRGQAGTALPFSGI